MGERVNGWRVAGVLSTLVLTIGCRGEMSMANAGSTGVEVSTVKHRGLEGCVSLSAGSTTAVVVPAWAGRLSELDFTGTGQANLFLPNEKLDGRTLDPSMPWAPWDGNPTDLKRTGDGRNQWPGLWLHPWPNVNMLPGSVEVQSDEAAAGQTGLVFAKRYQLSPDGKQLTYTATIKRVSGDEADGWTIWERAMMPVSRYLIAPLGVNEAYPRGWMTRDNSTVDPVDRVTTQDGYLVLRVGTSKGVGLAAHLRAGWLGVVFEQGILLMTYPIDEKGVYPHYDGANAIFWITDKEIEIEPISAELKVKTGQSASFVQQWRWLGAPKGVNLDDPKAVGRYIEKVVGK
ncbi:MAG: hypothetical protein IT442_01005 [Phycisphaeraceae bacterium]|nr:hypothetical protein [Phycisphaeraceae bacterium]